MVAQRPLPRRESSWAGNPHPIPHDHAPGQLVLLTPRLAALRDDATDGICPGAWIGVVLRRVGLDLGAGHRRGRSEVSVTIDDDHVAHTSKGNARPWHQADVHGGRRASTGGEEE